MVSSGRRLVRARCSEHGMGLRLRFDYAAAGLLFAVVGLSLSANGLRLLIGGNPGGVVVLIVGLGGLGIVAVSIRGVIEVVFDGRDREVRSRWLLCRRGLPRQLPFDRLQALVVEVQAGGNAALVLEPKVGDRVVLDVGWRPWQAEEAALRVAALTGCAARRLEGGQVAELIAEATDGLARAARPSSSWIVARALATVLAVVGAAGFAGGLVVSVYEGTALDRVELPLGDAEGLAVDGEGRVWVGARAYRRVQRYLPDGSFDRGWHLPAARGTWRFSIGDDDCLLVVVGAGSGNPQHLVVDDAGERRPVDVATARPAGAGGVRLWDEGGVRYRLRALPVSVTRTTGAGPARTVVRQGLHLWLVQAPLPAWAVFGVGLVSLIVLDRRSRARARVPGSD